MTSEEVTTLLYWAYRYLGYRSRSEKEMRDYLEKKAATYGFPVEKADEALSSLRDENYINDERFIEEFVTSRTRHKPKGEYALRQELLQKGIQSKLIDSYFATHKIPEDKLALDTLSRVWNRYSNSDTLKRKQKSIQYLRRRGFSFDTIQKAIEELEGREYN